MYHVRNSETVNTYNALLNYMQLNAMQNQLFLFCKAVRTLLICIFVIILRSISQYWHGRLFSMEGWMVVPVVQLASRYIEMFLKKMLCVFGYTIFILPKSKHSSNYRAARLLSKFKLLHLLLCMAGCLQIFSILDFSSGLCVLLGPVPLSFIYDLKVKSFILKLIIISVFS